MVLPLLLSLPERQDAGVFFLKKRRRKPASAKRWCDTTADDDTLDALVHVDDIPVLVYLEGHTLPFKAAHHTSRFGEMVLKAMVSTS